MIDNAKSEMFFRKNINNYPRNATGVTTGDLGVAEGKSAGFRRNAIFGNRQNFRKSVNFRLGSIFEIHRFFEL